MRLDLCGSRLAEVLIGNGHLHSISLSLASEARTRTDLRVFDSVFIAQLGISDFDILAGDGVPHGTMLGLASFAVISMVDRLAMLLVLFEFLVDLCVTLLFLFVELLHELMDVWDAVAAAVVLARRGNVLVDVHGGRRRTARNAKKVGRLGAMMNLGPEKGKGRAKEKGERGPEQKMRNIK